MNGIVWGAVGVTAGWLAALCLVLSWLAAKHWITAGILASMLVTAAWAFIASIAAGPAEVHPRMPWPLAQAPGALRYDYGQAWGYASGTPWEQFAVVAALFAWCLLRRRLRKQKEAFLAELAAARAAAAAPVIQVLPAGRAGAAGGARLGPAGHTFAFWRAGPAGPPALTGEMPGSAVVRANRSLWARDDPNQPLAGPN